MKGAINHHLKTLPEIWVKPHSFPSCWSSSGSSCVLCAVCLKNIECYFFFVKVMSQARSSAMLGRSTISVLSSPTGHKMELLRAFLESILVVYGREEEQESTQRRWRTERALSVFTSRLIPELCEGKWICHMSYPHWNRISCTFCSVNASYKVKNRSILHVWSTVVILDFPLDFTRLSSVPLYGDSSF